MTLAELKRRSRREVTSPFTEMTYTVRSLSQIEFTRIQLECIIPIDGESEAAKNSEPSAVLNHLKVVQWAIENGVVNPRVIYGSEDTVADGQVHASWIAEDEAWLYWEVLKQSGIDIQTQSALKDFLKNARGSEPITPSPENTDVSRAISSNSHPLN